MKKFALVIIVSFCCSGFIFAKENIGSGSGSGSGSGGQHRNSGPTGPDQVAAACVASTSHKDLDINNIRCPIWINGDMWWDLVGNAKYEVPKDSRKYSLFAGALWIGGKSTSGGLRVAAQTYRQSGSDFWPGPVDTVDATITSNVCLKYDRHWRVTQEEVDAFAHNPNINPSVDIKEWPGNGDVSLGQSHFLAPFHDNNGDGEYHYEDGDYPGYNLNTDPTIPDPLSATGEYLLGDQSLWWVFNDVGNIHTETNGASIGLEIQAQAFAFATNDEVNNMTFYKYKIINRSLIEVDTTYFGAWVDPDLGNYLDDYVGCDVKRGFGYCYNGDAYDDGITGYGFNPPAIGYDFFQGPKADVGDHLDNDRDGCVDCTYLPDSTGALVAVSDSVTPELIIMSKFVYYNNDFSVIGNPVSAADYYNYLKGIWKDNNHMTYGGNGHGAGSGTTTIPCDFMFPGCSDPTGWGTNHVPQVPWDEVTAGNRPDDRRFLQSAGPFTLMPGAVNYITTGAVWARAGSGGPGTACGQSGSIALVLLADDKAQKLFDHNFAITNGPDAPDLAIRELSQELLFSISNPEGTNNHPLGGNDESYHEIDPNLNLGDSLPSYLFEGYQVFQLKDGSVSVNDIHDPNKASLVFQCDKSNGVGQIVNYFKDPVTTAYYGVEEVAGDDKGLRHVFRLTKDKFATGDDRLINHKTYYYTVIAYGYNPIESSAFNYTNTSDGDGKPFISGRRRIKTYTAIPHIITPEANGLVLNSAFGDGPEITRIEGNGDGFVVGSDRLALDLTSASVDEIIFNSTHRSLHPIYQRARGPVDIRVYDPVKVLGGTFELWSDSINYGSNWHMKNLSTGEVLNSTSTIGNPYDQLIKFTGSDGNPVDYGFYVNMTQLTNTPTPADSVTLADTALLYPGDIVGKAAIPQFIEATLKFENTSQRWLGGLADQDNSPYNWIASGSDPNDYAYYPVTGSQIAKLDDNNVWGKLIGGTWTAYKFAGDDSSTHSNPPINDPLAYIRLHMNQFKDQASVDVVFTPDQRYWSKCVVIEQCDNLNISIGHAIKGTPRRSPSLDINGNTIPGDSGLSYFPGYAINIETGERLNIAFGEDSHLASDHGADMKWNPTSTTFDADGNAVFGGKHVVYVFAHNDTMPLYDGCANLYSRLKHIQTISSINVPSNWQYFRTPWSSCMWVGYTMLGRGESLLATKATVRIRVARPYEKYQTDVPASNNSFPKYRFNTDDLVARTGDLSTAQSALDIINVVPNPYYSYSSYEANQLDNRIKIINLPPKCVVSIYTPNGILIRQLRRDVTIDNTSGGIYPETNLETALEWDLKNTAGVPVASGVYIIHVNAPGIGEKTIKWFGVLRPIDLDTF